MNECSSTDCKDVYIKYIHILNYTHMLTYKWKFAGKEQKTDSFVLNNVFMSRAKENTLAH